MNDREKLIAGLRKIADVLETNQEAKIPYFGPCVVRVDDSEQLLAQSRVFGGKWAKSVSDDSFNLRQHLGCSLELYLYADRENVCKKIVIGTKLVPETVIEAQIIPAHEEEIVEWHCPESLREMQLEAK